MYREQEFPFIYERGVIRPQGPVDLPEGARGIAHVREDAALNGSDRRNALATIRRIGESGVFNSGGLRLTRDQMHERR